MCWPDALRTGDRKWLKSAMAKSARPHLRLTRVCKAEVRPLRPLSKLEHASELQGLRSLTINIYGNSEVYSLIGLTQCEHLRNLETLNVQRGETIEPPPFMEAGGGEALAAFFNPECTLSGLKVLRLALPDVHGAREHMAGFDSLSQLESLELRVRDHEPGDLAPVIFAPQRASLRELYLKFGKENILRPDDVDDQVDWRDIEPLSRAHLPHLELLTLPFMDEAKTLKMARSESLPPAAIQEFELRLKNA